MRLHVEMCAASLRGSSTLSVPHLLQEESKQQQNGGSSGNGGGPDPKKGGKPRKEGAAQLANSVMDKAGVSLGPIGLTVGSELQNLSLDDEDGVGAAPRPKSYASLSTAEWRALYEKDGYVDLWVEEEFNSGSRLIVSGAVGQGRWRGGVGWGGMPCRTNLCAADNMKRQAVSWAAAVSAAAGRQLTALSPVPPLAIAQGGSAVYRGGVAGYLSGEGPGLETAQRHKVRITNNYTNEEFEVEVPEDRCAERARQGRGVLVASCCEQQGKEHVVAGVLASLLCMRVRRFVWPRCVRHAAAAFSRLKCCLLAAGRPTGCNARRLPVQVHSVVSGGGGLRPALRLPPGLLHRLHSEGQGGRGVPAALAGPQQEPARPGERPGCGCDECWDAGRG